MRIDHKVIKTIYDYAIKEHTPRKVWSQFLVIEDDRGEHVYSLPVEIFVGDVAISDCFVIDSQFVLTTARWIYEANVHPGEGLIKFTPEDSTFEIWKELPIPDIHLAYVSADQDEKEL